MKRGAVLRGFAQRLRQRRAGRLRQQQQMHAPTAAGAAAEDKILVAARIEIHERRATAGENRCGAAFELRFQAAATDHAVAQAVAVEQHERAGLLVGRTFRRDDDAEQCVSAGRMQALESGEQPTGAAKGRRCLVHCGKWYAKAASARSGGDSADPTDVLRRLAPALSPPASGTGAFENARVIKATESPPPADGKRAVISVHTESRSARCQQHASILDRFAQVRRAYRHLAGQIGDRARHAQDAVVGTRGQSEPVEGALEQVAVR